MVKLLKGLKAGFMSASLPLNPFNPVDSTITYANSVDPDEMAHNDHLTRIYTICQSVDDFE